jgi:hypothetical protein
LPSAGLSPSGVIEGCVDERSSTFGSDFRVFLKPSDLWSANSEARILRGRSSTTAVGRTRALAMLKVYEQEENHNSPRFSLTIFAEADGLMSYGTEWIDLFGRVLVEEPTKFELVINLKTDKALGLTISQSLLQRSD